MKISAHSTCVFGRQQAATGDDGGDGWRAGSYTVCHRREVGADWQWEFSLTPFLLHVFDVRSQHVYALFYPLWQHCSCLAHVLCIGFCCVCVSSCNLHVCVFVFVFFFVCVCTSLCVQVSVCMHVWHVSDYDDDKEDLRSMGCLSMLQQGVYVCIWLVCMCAYDLYVCVHMTCMSMCVCMCAYDLYVHVCVYVCIWLVCPCVCAYDLHVHVCVYVCIWLVCPCVCVCVHMTCMYVCVYVCIWLVYDLHMTCMSMCELPELLLPYCSAWWDVYVSQTQRQPLSFLCSRSKLHVCANSSGLLLVLFPSGSALTMAPWLLRQAGRCSVPGSPLSWRTPLVHKGQSVWNAAQHIWWHLVLPVPVLLILFQ